MAFAQPVVAPPAPSGHPPARHHHHTSHGAKPAPETTRPASVETTSGKPAVHKTVAHRPVVAPAVPDIPAAPPPQADLTPPPASPPEAAASNKGSVTGLPLPRFASLRSDEVNLRSGPGTRYPIDWVYQRRDLPVEIEREFEVWRLIEDPQGTKGWVHQATLTGRRGMVVTAAERTLRASANPQSAAIAKLMPGVVGRILKCDASAWCEVQVGDYRGWLQRNEFWGSFPGETVQ